MSELLTILFLLTAPPTNAPVCDATGKVCGWWDKSLCQLADVTVASNGVFQLQWTEVLTNNSWVGLAVLDGSRTNRVTLPITEGFMRLVWRQ